jgi:hypothetical protein
MNKLLIGGAAILGVAGMVIATDLVAKHNDAIAKHNHAIEQCQRDTIAKLTAEADARADEAWRRSREEFGRVMAGVPVDTAMKLLGPLLTPDAMIVRHNIEEEARRRAEKQIADTSRDICDRLIDGH